MMKRLMILCLFFLSLPGLAFAAEPVKQPHKSHHKTATHKKTHRQNKKNKPHKKNIKKMPTQKAAIKPIKKPEAPIQKETIATPIISAPEKKHHFTMHRYHFQNPHLIKRSVEFAQTTKAELVDWVHRAVSSMQYTRYRMGGTNFNLSRGTYVVDCSEYVDRLLNLAIPKAYASLVNSTHTDRPTSQDYYQFIKNLPDNASSQNWEKVDDVGQLKAGDILVFRYDDENDGPGGHVMIVMDKPSQDSDDPNAYNVKVSDSAPARHSDDTRLPHTSGVGIGTLMLKENPDTHEPDAYAWTVDSGWKRIDAVMAEPVSQNS